METHDPHHPDHDPHHPHWWNSTPLQTLACVLLILFLLWCTLSVLP